MLSMLDLFCDFSELYRYSCMCRVFVKIKKQKKLLCLHVCLCVIEL